MFEQTGSGTVLLGADCVLHTAILVGFGLKELVSSFLGLLRILGIFGIYSPRFVGDNALRLSGLSSG